MLTITLNEMFEMLGNEAIAEQIEIPNDEARQKYQLDGNTVESYQEYHEELVMYYIHHMLEVQGPPPEDPVTASAQSRRIIEQAFQRHGGYEIAYNHARMGRFGGMAASLDAISNSIKEEQKKNYIEYLFHQFIDYTNFEDHVELMRQYLAHFGNYLPDDGMRRSPEDLARDYDKVIKTHAEVINNIRSSMQRFS